MFVLKELIDNKNQFFNINHDNQFFNYHNYVNEERVIDSKDDILIKIKSNLPKGILINLPKELDNLFEGWISKIKELCLNYYVAKKLKENILKLRDINFISIEVKNGVDSSSLKVDYWIDN